MGNLGDRIKRYESVSKARLLSRVPVFIRIDGRAFHTFTKGLEKPFDAKFIDTMQYAMVETSKHMSGFKLAYHQSDEVTFMLTDYDTLQTQPWFDYEVNKLVSITASLFTSYFIEYGSRVEIQLPKLKGVSFDARAFNVPIDDAPNVFVWRQQDWERNSLSMLAQHHFPHRELQGKGRQDMHELLHSKGVNWANLEDRYKNGTFVNREQELLAEKLDYIALQALITPTWTE